MLCYFEFVGELYKILGNNKYFKPQAHKTHMSPKAHHMLPWCYFFYKFNMHI